MKERNLATRPGWGLKAAEDEPSESGDLIVNIASETDPVHSSSNNVGHRSSMLNTRTWYVIFEFYKPPSGSYISHLGVETLRPLDHRVV